MPPTTSNSPAIELSTPLQFLKGGGAARAELLSRLGVHTVRDLLFFFPRDYQDLTDVRPIDALEEGSLVSILGTVEEIDLADRGQGRSILGVLVRQQGSYLRAVWFNQPWMREQFRRGQLVLLSGKPKRKTIRWEMAHPRVKIVEADQGPPAGQIMPVYPLTEGLTQPTVRKLVQNALASCASQLDEVFPAGYLQSHELMPIHEALAELHFPGSREQLRRAVRRFIYQELLVLQLALALKQQQTRDLLRAAPLELTARIDARIRRLLPFELTTGQNEAIAQIAADMGRNHPMNRLLQGDVGSGKTIVAVYAMLLAVAHQTQVALMAPTEILARQHYETLDRLLAKSQTKIALLTGAVTGRAREDLLTGIANGETQIVIGTQAVASADVSFKRLGLVVIDEQHKFGVRQRAALKQSGVDPHYLVMTATPIPRTIAMTLFGDLDETTLSDAPPGRQQVHTYLPPTEDYPKWWDFFRKKLRQGRQGYVIVPLIDGAEDSEMASLNQTYEELVNGELEAFRLGLVHGGMAADEKQQAMIKFAQGETQVLVATSVVEVGIDVANATLMTILNAEYFGLAQLHQLRGRISRGSFPGYCCLFATPTTDEARQRLETLVATNNGFELAQRDLELRGPGDLLGTRQHGLPPLRIANLVRDAAVVEESRADARKLVASDPGLKQPEHAALRRMALIRYGRSLELGDVG